jgi:thiosulfate dehydrogenase [quinone] large subunit
MAQPDVRAQQRATATTSATTASPDIEVIPDRAGRGETPEQRTGRYVLAVTRLSLGFIFLWAFVDKLFGLGRSTPEIASWLNGNSPTSGFLSSVDGPFAGFYNGMANNAFVDWLFMLGLLGIGGALMLGIGMRIAAATGALLMVLMWTASLPVASNPFMDEHLIYALVLVALALLHQGDTIGLGRMWANTGVVRRFPILR